MNDRFPPATLRSWCILVAILFCACLMSRAVASTPTGNEPSNAATANTIVAAANKSDAVSACLKLITPQVMQQLTNHLASDEMNGRYYLSEDGHKAARYIAREFENAGLAGMGENGSFFQGIGNKKASPNVVAIRKGKGKGHIILSAHYDHLEPKKKGKDRIFNGADDNAAGVAALIAIARALQKVDPSFPGSIAFIAFTGEEYGHLGSKFYVKRPLLPLERTVAVINADMISRGKPDLLFVEGGRIFPELTGAFRRGNGRPEVALDLRFDEHPRWLYMSDQKQFVLEGVPSVYLGVDFHPDTHKVTDEADRILPGLAARTARLMLAASIDLLRNPPAPPSPARN